MDILAYILLTVYPNIGNSLGEKIFIGVLTGLTIGLFFFFKDKRNARKESKRIEFENQEKGKRSYHDALHEIVNESNVGDIISIEEIRNLLIDQCNPKNFCEPFDTKKIEAATQIYVSLKSETWPLNIKTLWQLAENSLGVYLDSTSLYEILSKIYNPTNFVDENFDELKFRAANKAFSYINEHKDSLRELYDFCSSLNLTSNQVNEIPVVCDFELTNINKGKVVYICGMYAMDYVGEYKGCQCFYQINDTDACLSEEILSEYIKTDNLNRRYLEIPKSICKRYSTSEVKILN